VIIEFGYAAENNAFGLGLALLPPVLMAIGAIAVSSDRSPVKPRLRETVGRAAIGLHRARTHLRVARNSAAIRANASAVQRQLIRDFLIRGSEEPGND